ncbi:MAG: sel1 repeat family protein [Alphaproteobacteria bacterium]|nr:MAG: sel1 repeat family protein [Alphaproteobacteria bacterium]
MIATRWKSLMLPMVAALLLAVQVAPSASARQTTAASLSADRLACTEAKDSEACNSAYNYVNAQIKAANGANTDALKATFRDVMETGCAINNGQLCGELGAAYLGGLNGYPKDKSIAREKLERGCELGHSKSCEVAGIFYDAGVTVTVDRSKATSLYEKGCDLSSFPSCALWAEMLLKAHVEAAPAALVGIAGLKSRCADYALDGPSCIAVGMTYQRGSDGAEKNETLAWQYWAKACREISYGPACTLHGLAVIRISSPKEPESSANREARQALQKACSLGEVEACEFLIPAADVGRMNYGPAMAEAHYRLCLAKPSLAQCERAARAFASGKLPTEEFEYGFTPNKPKATLAWLTACRAFNTRCVEAANLHLEKQAFALPSPNLAIGILETACSKGDAAACTRKAAVITETGGVKGSYIDPLSSDDERYMLAKFDMDSGDLNRGRETMQWLANTGHSDAQLELAIAYETGLSPTPDGRGIALFNANDMMGQLFELAAQKGIPDAAMRVAVRKYNENDYEGSDSYTNAIYRANYLGAEGAEEFYLAVIERNKARWEAKSQELIAMNRRNVEARNNMDRQTVQRAWDQYAENRRKEAEEDGGQVCGRVIGQGNSSYRTCMSRDHANKYYRGNF